MAGCSLKLQPGKFVQMRGSFPVGNAGDNITLVGLGLRLFLWKLLGYLVVALVVVVVVVVYVFIVSSCTKIRSTRQILLKSLAIGDID
jgi:hypothetical protein